MAPHKIERAEDFTWDDPILTFVIERHGGTMLGSSRAELQAWTVNLQDHTADVSPAGHLQLTPTRPRFDMQRCRQIAAAIAEKVAAGEDDPLLNWTADRKQVQILTSDAINPEGGQLATQTAAGRRRRLLSVLLPELERIGWQPCQPLLPISTNPLILPTCTYITTAGILADSNTVTVKKTATKRKAPAHRTPN